MRCCISTLDEHMSVATTLPKEGDILDCKYEKEGNQSMIFRDGAWEWNPFG